MLATCGIAHLHYVEFVKTTSFSVMAAFRRQRKANVKRFNTGLR